MPSSRNPIPRRALAPAAGLLAAALLATTVLRAALGPSLPTAVPAPAQPSPALVDHEATDTGVPDARRVLRGQPEPLGMEAPSF